MKEIDLSKAPEGATHYRKDSALPWRMLEDGEWYCWEPDEENWIAISDPIPEQYFPIGDRPDAAWAGEGLPPVGTVCEVANPDQIDEWCECTVLAHDGPLAVFRANGDYPWLYDGTQAGNFRPLRTPEQIAAEEREKAIEEMARIGTMADTPKSMAAKLYDAGCRMVTQ